MDNHGHVKNPKELIQEAKNRRRHDNRLLYYNDIVLEWITNHVLASVIFFDIALIVPLLTLNASDTVKITLAVISSSWIQWWALPALQRSQNKTQAQNEAKAKVDHQTLTYLAKLQDEQMTELKSIAEILRNLKNTESNIPDWLVVHRSQQCVPRSQVRRITPPASLHWHPLLLLKLLSSCGDRRLAFDLTSTDSD